MPARGPRHPKRVRFWGLPGCLSAQISAELWCVMLEDGMGEDETRTFPLPGVGDDETRTFPLPMGIEKEDKYE